VGLRGIRPRANEPKPAADAMNVGIDRQNGLPAREQQHAGRRLGPDAGKPRQVLDGLRRGDVPKEVERQVSSFLVDLPQDGFDARAF